MKDAADFELDQDEDTNVRLKFDNPGSEMTWLAERSENYRNLFIRAVEEGVKKKLF